MDPDRQGLKSNRRLFSGRDSNSPGNGFRARGGILLYYMFMVGILF